MGASLAIERPSGRVIKLALIFIMGYLVLGELFFRIDAVRAGLTGPRIGSQHRQFEIQVARLEKLVDEGQPIDCIFLGNSMTWLGINPLTVDRAFQDETGQEIHCFNFGVSGLPASSAGQIAPVLVERYHPRVLIYGTFARDYVVPADSEDAYVVADTPWLRYQNGEFSLTGWLYSYSALYQYKAHMRDFLFMNYLEDVFAQHDAQPYYAYGLDPKYDVRLDVRVPPDLESKDNRDLMKLLGSYEIQQENLEGLRCIAQQADNGVQVIIIEMPFAEYAYEFFPNKKQDYDAYIEHVDLIAASTHTPFWRRDVQPVLAPDGWWDYVHLNLQGADVFSEWLGKQLAATYMNGELGISPMAAP